MRKITISLLFLLIGALLVGSVSAVETVDYQENIRGYGSAYSTSHWASSTGVWAGTPANRMRLESIQNWGGLRAFSGTITPGTYSSCPSTSQSFPVVFQISGVTIGEGIYGSFIDSAGNYKIWFELSDWDVTGYSGNQVVNIVKTGGTGSFPIQGLAYTSRTGTSPIGTFFLSSSYYQAIDCVWYFDQVFKLDYVVSSEQIGNAVVYNYTFVRNVDGEGYTSDIRAVNPSQTFISNLSSNADFAFLLTQPPNEDYEATPVSLSIKDVFGNWYNRTLYGSVEPTPTPTIPGSSTTATVTLFVKRSDTGALISNANVSIYDSVLDTYIVENSTLPGGSGSFVVNKTGDTPQDWVHYQVLAYADGFTQNVPVFFGITQDITVPVELVPVGEAPADTDNVYVQFNVRDYAANGVPSVTINLGGTAKTTNSAGYVRFEVAKNSTLSWTATKSGYITSSGTVTTATTSPVNVQVLLYSGVIPTYTPTPGSTSPGATPYVTPDTRTPHEKAASGLDFLLNNAENFGVMAAIILLTYMGYWMVPKKGR